MTSRVLFSNLMKEDFKKKIWIIVMAMIVFIFINPVHLLMEIEGAYQNTYLTPENIASSMQYYLSASYFGNSILPAILAIVLGIAGFSFLFSKKKVDLYHSIPVKREKLFFASYLNGIIIYLGVYLMTQLLSVATMGLQGLMNAEGWKTVGIAFVGITIHFLFFYNVTIIAVMLTGNMFVCVAAVITLLFYGPMTCQIVDGLFSQYFVTYYADYAYSSSWLTMPLISPISSLMYFCEKVGQEDAHVGMNLMAAFLIAIILLAVAVFLYKKRPSEVAGKAMSYKIAEPIVRVLVVILVALMGGLYIQNMSNGLSSIWFWFGVLFMGIICHVVMEVIYRFDFKAAMDHKLQMAGSLMVAVLIGLCFHYDWFGYDTYIPRADQIESAAVVLNSIDRDMNNCKITEDTTGQPTLTYVDKESALLKNMYLTDFQDVLSLAQAGIEQRDHGERNGNIMPRAALFGAKMAVAERVTGTDGGSTEEKNQYVIRYRLKSGRVVTRSYTATIGSTIEATGNIYKKPEYKDAAYSLAQIKDSGILTSIEGYNVWGDKVLTATGKDMTELLDTFTGEMKDLTIDTLKNEMPVLRIDGIYKADGYSNSIYGYYVYPSFTKTLNMLKELGVTEEDMSDRISLEQIQSITVNDYGYLAAKDGEENKNYSASVFYEAEADGDDAAKIKELNEHIVLSNFIWSNGILHPVENSIDAQVQLYRTSGNDKNGYVNIWKGEVPTSIEQDLRENRVYYE